LGWGLAWHSMLEVAGLHRVPSWFDLSLCALYSPFALPPVLLISSLTIHPVLVLQVCLIWVQLVQDHANVFIVGSCSPPNLNPLSLIDPLVTISISVLDFCQQTLPHPCHPRPCCRLFTISDTAVYCSDIATSLHGLITGKTDFILLSSLFPPFYSLYL
jgi:hypothetical protein